MRVAVGADHAGYEMKNELAALLTEMGHEVTDFGTNSPDPVDYPDLAWAVARAVAAGRADRGLIVCGTGIGTCIVANKVAGVRAALCHDTFSARATREHNDSNVLCLGARVIGPSPAIEIVKIWIDTAFAGGRHERRVNRIAEIEAEGGPAVARQPSCPRGR
jgi:ribose 5-phosphate isomerase B